MINVFMFFVLLYTGQNFVDEFEESVKMSSYLVAFVVCEDYAFTTNTTQSGVKVSVVILISKVFAS